MIYTNTKVIPESYFTNIEKILDILERIEPKNISGKEIARLLDVSNNYIYPNLRTMRSLGLIYSYGGGNYSISEDGLNLWTYLKGKEDDKIKKFGESLIFDHNSTKTEILRIAYYKLKDNPSISDFDLGTILADEANKSWVAKSSYEKLGGFCKSILKGFYLIDNVELKKENKKLSKIFIKEENNGELLGNLNRYCNQFISIVSQDKNAWKNYIELRQKIEENYDKLIETQNEFIVKDYLKSSKKWLKEGFNTKNIDYIHESINIIAKLDYNNIIK